MTKTRIAVVPAVAALLAATTLGAGAFDTVITDGTVAGAQYLNLVGETILIEAGGTIDIGSGAVYGITANSDNNQIVNFGGIYTYADCAYGIYALGDYFTLTNHGAIQTDNWASSGVYASATDFATILNNGSITTQGAESHAITVAGVGTRITNHGHIDTTGDGSVGIYTWASGAGSDVVIVNSGTVRASGGIWTNSDSMDIAAHAIQSKAPGAHIINSGTVISTQADAFAMDAADQTLTLLPGSIVVGGIRFADPTTATFNLGDGLNATLTLTNTPDLDHLTINTSGQYALVEISPTEQVLTVVSPDIAEAGNAATTAITGTISNVIAGHSGGRRQNLDSGSALLGYVPAPAAPDFPDFAPSDDFGLWASGYGSFSTPTGDAVGTTSIQAGALVGMDARLTNDSLAGVFAGLGRGVIDASADTSIENTALVGGGYASFALGGAFIDLNAVIGATINQSTRRILNNKAPGGYDTASGSYTGLFVSPSIRLGLDQEIASARVTPSVALMYAGIYQDGYTETGVTTPLTMSSQVSHVLNARAEVEIAAIDHSTDPLGWNTSFTLGADGTVTHGGAASATIMGKVLDFDAQSALEARGFVGANAEYTSGAYTFSASTELGYSTTGIFSASVRGGLGSRF